LNRVFTIRSIAPVFCIVVAGLLAFIVCSNLIDKRRVRAIPDSKSKVIEPLPKLSFLPLPSLKNLVANKVATNTQDLCRFITDHSCSSVATIKLVDRYFIPIIEQQNFVAKIYPQLVYSGFESDGLKFFVSSLTTAEMSAWQTLMQMRREGNASLTQASSIFNRIKSKKGFLLYALTSQGRLYASTSNHAFHDLPIIERIGTLMLVSEELSSVYKQNFKVGDKLESFWKREMRPYPLSAQLIRSGNKMSIRLILQSDDGKFRSLEENGILVQFQPIMIGKARAKVAAFSINPKPLYIPINNYSPASPIPIRNSVTPKINNKSPFMIGPIKVATAAAFKTAIANKTAKKITATAD
jgi:hypothetical protein